MPLLRKAIDFIILGSNRPLRRLLAYYAALIALVAAVMWAFPSTQTFITGTQPVQADQGAIFLQDGLSAAAVRDADLDSVSKLQLATAVLVALLGTLILMIPSAWVYMSARHLRRHNQVMAQTLIILPVVVAGIVFVVRDSLALAFSLAGVVAAVRFRTTMSDARDLVFIFLAIAVGFSAGVQSIIIGALVSMVFNFVVLLSWRYDFGRNVLTPRASAKWSEPLASLAATNGSGHAQIPDRELVLALTPQRAQVLAERFTRIRNMVSNGKKKPRYNAVLSVTTDSITEVQESVEGVLAERAKRWTLDEVITHTGKPSELFWLVKLGRSLSGDQLVTEIRSNAGPKIGSVDVELCDEQNEKAAAVA
ncbi:MAG: DUF4956 domain-containing protein [Gemmatimonadota bacterium]